MWCLAWLVLFAAAEVERSDIEKARRVADELERDRAFGPAILQLDALLALVTKEERFELGLRRCTLMQRAGDLAAAQRCCMDMSAVDPRATLYAIQLSDALGAPRAEQEQALLSLVAAHPASDAARRALAPLVVVAKDEDAALAEVARRVRSEQDATTLRELLAEVWVRRTRLALSRGDTEAALEHAKRAEAVAADSVWQDDAAFVHAMALRQAGRLRAALAIYEALIEARRASFFVGSYDSAYLDDAYLERARVLAELGELEHAREAIGRMKKDVPTSRLLDDAVRLEATLVGHGSR